MLTIAHDKKILAEYNLQPQLLVGTDEAGRGPLAGPLVVAGVLFDEGVEIEGIFDSKKISEKKRDLLAEEIKSKAKFYHIEIISEEEVDRLNIYQASKWGMIQCFLNIQKQIEVSVLLTDAMKISPKELPDVSVIPLVKGDQKSFHIAAASILAKTTRDEIMKKLHDKYPEYGWQKNKGYPTKAHRLAIAEYGATPHHRKTFKLLG